MFNTICTFEHLLESYYLARNGNRYKEYSCQFDLYLESNLLKLRYELTQGLYRPLPYTYFVVSYPKKRHVAAPHFRDRVLQHALVSTIEPVFDNMFITDAYACRINKGTHYAAKRVKKFLQAAHCQKPHQPVYALQCDVRHFFSSISWDILLALVYKRIPCLQTRRLITSIITTHQAVDTWKRPIQLPDDVISPTLRRGLPIGNLTSQLFANIYLHELDFFVKQTLREKWYGRYMDDFFILHHDKHHLLEVRKQIDAFLHDRLKLTLHPNKNTILSSVNGIPFVGYRIYYDHMCIRGSTLLRFQKRLQQTKRRVRMGKIPQAELDEKIISFQGHLKHANAYGLSNCMIEKKTAQQDTIDLTRTLSRKETSVDILKPQS